VYSVHSVPSVSISINLYVVYRLSTIYYPLRASKGLFVSNSPDSLAPIPSIRPPLTGHGAIEPETPVPPSRVPCPPSPNETRRPSHLVYLTPPAVLTLEDGLLPDPADNSDLLLLGVARREVVVVHVIRVSHVIHVVSLTCSASLNSILPLCFRLQP
jgi:hypothetical protein